MCCRSGVASGSSCEGIVCPKRSLALFYLICVEYSVVKNCDALVRTKCLLTVCALLRRVSNTYVTASELTWAGVAISHLSDSWQLHERCAFVTG